VSMPSLSPRERVVVGVGALVALVIGGYLLVVEPILARSRIAEATVPVREAALERRRLLVGQRSRLAEELAAVDARLEMDARRLLRGPTAPLAASELQKIVKDLLAAGSVEIRSERVLPASDQNGLLEVPIELTIFGNIRDIVNALSRLEGADRLLAAKDFKIRVVAVGQPRELLTTLTVAGYLLPGATPARPEARAAATPEEH
jgi:type II secretory pathway component PulM